jgi:serine/threonine protein phosphatase PrpC
LVDEAKLLTALSLYRFVLKSSLLFLKIGLRDLTGTRGSGTTASVVVLFQDHLLVANVGDSRVVLCCSSTFDKTIDTNLKRNIITIPVQLTVDHTPHDIEERIAVENKGGFIMQDGVLRVNGKLAVTRSLGDFILRDVITPRPDVTVLRLKQKTATDKETKNYLDREDSKGKEINSVNIDL